MSCDFSNINSLDELRKPPYSLIIKEEGDRDWHEDYDRHHDKLQAHPGDGTPIDIGGADRFGDDATQIKQRKAEGRVHEAGLHIDAEHDAKPDQRRILSFSLRKLRAQRSPAVNHLRIVNQRTLRVSFNAFGIWN